MIVKEELEALVSRYQVRLDDLQKDMTHYEKSIEKQQAKIEDYQTLITELSTTYIDTMKRKKKLQEFIEQTW